ncbi:Oxysterol-binding protein-related protein 9 [Heterocephalus glaber]|uniref:Oxysterol-binding protein-related protein 9 n=1 Tax=Heterocephalus glaber TaxID=10181 RepID=G5BE07_HETGA|nr:Oxysterol-binding protein-related protein 9 [Heterocephalus glaber]
MAFLLAACGGLDSASVPSVQDFDKKLTEADAYLQILIEQLKLFDKLQNCKDDGQRKKIETLKETTNSMVESIKHCIVLLQIAKSTINPVDAIYQPSSLEPVIITIPSQTVLPPEPTQLCKSEQRPSSLSVGPVLATLGHHQTPTPNSTGSGDSPPSRSLTSPNHINLSPNTVPEFSYSSSEDEFYDPDEFHQSSSSPKRLIDSSGSASVLTHSSSGNSLKRPDTTESLNSSTSNGRSDADLFDSQDDRDDDGEAGSVEEHKSVILHLLGQIEAEEVNILGHHTTTSSKEEQNCPQCRGGAPSGPRYHKPESTGGELPQQRRDEPSGLLYHHSE